MYTNRIGGSLLLAFFIAYTYFTGDIYLDFWSEEEAFDAQTFPYLIGGAGIILASLVIILPGGTSAAIPRLGNNVIAAFLLLTLTSCYGLLLEYLGFLLASGGFLLGGFVVLGERSLTRICITTLVLIGGFWFLMDGLDIYLSRGRLIENLFEAFD